MAAGLRERKTEATRIALSWAAIRLAVERGYASTRIEDIADAAGVSVRTFRNYFSSKAEAIAARHLDRVQAVAEELRERPREEPLWTAIRAATHTMMALGADAAGDDIPSREWIEGVRLMLGEPALRGELQRVNGIAAEAMCVAVAERTGTDPERDVYPKLVAAVFGAALGVAIDQWLGSEPPISMGAVLDEAFDHVEAGMLVHHRGSH
jgi:AcrR family transcriptional regulator